MHKISDKMIRRFIVDEGLTDAQVAEKLSVSRMTISRRRNKLKIVSKPKRPEGYYDLTREQDLKLRELYASGLNDYEVADKMHLGRSRLREWRNGNGIESQSNKKDLDFSFCLGAQRYLEEGDTLEEVSGRYGISRSSLSRAFKRFGLSTGNENAKRPAWVQSYELTRYQEKVLVGDLFGDGHIAQTSDKTSAYSCSHSIKQEDFALWKYSVFAPMSSGVYYGDQKNYYNPDNGPLPFIAIRTWSAGCFHRFRQLFYKGGVKVLRPELVDYMDPVSLAVWYMGDGSRSRNTAVFHVGLGVDLKPIAESLYERFGVSFVVRRYDREWHLRVVDSSRFFELIVPHVIPAFEKKIPEIYRGSLGQKIQVKRIPQRVEVSTEVYKALPEKQQIQIRESLYLYYRKRGFPYPVMSISEIKKEISKMLLKEPSISYIGKEGQSICNVFMPHRYHGKRYDGYPMSHWEDDLKFKKLIVNRLNHIGGTITDAAMRRGIALKGIPANFSPMLAAAVYQEYAHGSFPSLDFSAGYGGRLLGYLRSRIKSGYHGVEPLSKSYTGLKRLKQVCCPLFGEPTDNIRLINRPFEDITFKAQRYGLVFSSPPYYRLEEYGDEETQSIVRYKSYQEWLTGFWSKVISNAKQLLIPGGFFIFSIGNYLDYDLISDSLRLADMNGFEEFACHKLSYHNVYKNKKKPENIFVFKK